MPHRRRLATIDVEDDIPVLELQRVRLGSAYHKHARVSAEVLAQSFIQLNQLHIGPDIAWPGE